MDGLTETRVQWMTAAPFWAQAASASDAASRLRLRQPAILRFATDTFMDDFLAMLEADSAQVARLRAQPETWRSPSGDEEPPARSIVDLVRARRSQQPAASRNGSNSRRLQATAASALGLVETAAPAAAATIAATATPAPKRKLKLYQPAHQRYYLVSGCLVCRIPGLPDRVINSNNQERVTFVVRRLRPTGSAAPDLGDPTTFEEYAFIDGSSGNRGWQKVDDGRELTTGEEQLPLFGVNFAAEDGRKRRLFAGMVPVGRRETYAGAPKRVNGAAVIETVLAGKVGVKAPPDPREVMARAQVIEPWKSLIDQAEAVNRRLSPVNDPTAEMPSENQKRALVDSTRNDIQSVSWLVLVDFARYLQQVLPNVWQDLNGQKPDPDLSPAQIILRNSIRNTRVGSALSTALGGKVSSSLEVALKRVLAFERSLDDATANFDGVLDGDWPDFRFPLADPVAGLLPALPPPVPGRASSTSGSEWDRQRDLVDGLAEQIFDALPDQAPQNLPAVPLAAKPGMDMDREPWFVIRFVFERPRCVGLKPVLVSEPTDIFQMAGFFDPDAPARPIRIALPIDTTPAGLRKFDKNTAFMISDVLCGQINRVKKLSFGDLIRSVLPWPFHKDLDVSADQGPCKDDQGSLGMICSLSIPIITICALILLIMIAFVLDVIFHWIPFFILCFPLPKFLSKKS